MLPIDGSNPAPVSNTGDVDGQDAPDEKTADTVSIIGVGDIMLGSNYPVDYLPDTNILKNVESALQDADITVGNLEGTLFDEGGTPKKCATPPKYAMHSERPPHTGNTLPTRDSTTSASPTTTATTSARKASRQRRRAAALLHTRSR
nr:hypothetical protein [Neisseria meningitidis]